MQDKPQTTTITGREMVLKHVNLLVLLSSQPRDESRQGGGTRELPLVVGWPRHRLE